VDDGIFDDKLGVCLLDNNAVKGRYYAGLLIATIDPYDARGAKTAAAGQIVGYSTVNMSADMLQQVANAETD
jgi:hypothetical protein